MKRLAQIFLSIIAPSFILMACADTPANLNLIELSPQNCKVDNSTDSVEIIVSEVPGHSFITCDAQVVAVNPSSILFINDTNVAALPALPWVTNTDGNQSFVCRDSLDNCKLLYQL